MLFLPMPILGLGWLRALVAGAIGFWLGRATARR